MGGLLVYSDYIQRANDQSIQQWIGNNQSVLAQAETNAQEEMIGYIKQRYDVVMTFQPTLALSESTIYQANQLFQLNFSAFVAGNYSAGQYVSYTDGNVYRCILNTTGQTPGNATYWILIGPQLGFFYLAYPYPQFNNKLYYKIGSIVFWKGKIYQALISSICQTHYDDLQAHEYANIPLTNIFPDDPQFGFQYWGTGTPYSVTGNVPNYTSPAIYNPLTAYATGQRAEYNGLIWTALKNNTGITPGADIVTWQSETWTAGDNRSTMIVKYCTDITIWNIMPRIAPKAIPQVRKDNYEDALMWLQRVADGKVSTEAPKLQPTQGRRTRFGGNVKNINGY